ASLLAKAAEEAGAPQGIVQCLNEATIQGTDELMKHRRTGIILSTGGAGIVRAAYSSGTPALGVGPGNVAVLLEASADVDQAIAAVVEGKSFDYGTVCSSEQTLVAEAASRDRVLAALKANKAYLCDGQQSLALQKLLIGPNFRINPDCVGQAPDKIAEMAGFSVPAESSILVVELEGVGRDYPMSAEKLSPVLTVYFVRDFQESLDACETILNFGGRGHTCVIHSKNDERVLEFGLRMPAFRVLVNTPAPQGSTGITTNVLPSMTLGCGAIAGNITSDNVGPMHLINIKRIAYHVRDAESAFESPEAQAYFAGRPIPAAAPAQPSLTMSPPSSAGTGQSRISDAVGRYLAQRGLPAAARPPTAGGAAPVTQAAIANPLASVVDQFLSKRRAGATQATSPSSTTGSAASGHPATGTATAEGSPAPPAPPVVVVPFVSEDDVRQAILKEQKIYIDASTIVTPAARDLGDARGILVRTN
ncbi:MAG: aldehyde dehydrogenase family protein, partial [Planctomycetota bacterium]|nr:aldehyde dehydrogenase family protein [Planctomycetota bacterium]